MQRHIYIYIYMKEAVCISVHANYIEKGINQSLLNPAMGKIER